MTRGQNDQIAGFSKDILGAIYAGNNGSEGVLSNMQIVTYLPLSNSSSVTLPLPPPFILSLLLLYQFINDFKGAQAIAQGNLHTLLPSREASGVSLSQGGGREGGRQARSRRGRA